MKSGENLKSTAYRLLKNDFSPRYLVAKAYKKANKSTSWAIKKRSQHIFVHNFVKNQQILMQFSLLELTMNDTCDGMNFTHLT